MDPFPDDVKRFLDANVESIDQLEILRLVGERPGAEWTAAALGGEVQIDPRAAANHLAVMSGRGLLAAERRGADWVARHGPATPELAALVGRLLQLYKERPVSMIKLVNARAKDPLRTFADAFRFRKEGG